ncbi:haloacid dehalogenase [Photobacterium jeanii]|uniref:phosphoglycolate phosphatase n=1 Tax=Photobacterium jeanii TaxID=858640 RepID=A0A178K1Z5_9GAMM|nr:HAD family hydrolase [Photobacterium jeanii]OAN11126.1 haloacid dehalogenase [Photobacterium jeanii]PST90643.1 HAD family hydrolase [Photobacterium jeanii]
MEIKGLLFDKDGTLLEFHQMWLKVSQGVVSALSHEYRNEMAHQQITEQHLLEAIGIYGDYVDNHGLLASNPVEDTAQAWFEMLALQTELKAFSIEIKALFNQQVEDNPLLIQALPGVKDKLIKLKQMGYKLGIATADTKAATLFSLAQAELLELFDYLGYSDGDITPKPDPALLNGFCQQCELSPEQVVMFGDTVSDMEFGTNAGAHKVGVLTGTATLDELQPYTDVILSSVADFEPELLAR